MTSTASAAHRRVAWALFLISLVSYAYFFQGGGWNQNSRFDQVRAIVENGTFAINDFMVYRADTGPDGEPNLERYPLPPGLPATNIQLVANTGDVSKYAPDYAFYPNKPPGAVLLAVPVYFFIYHAERMAGLSPDDWWLLTWNMYLVTVFTAGLLGALGVVVFHAVSRRLFPRSAPWTHAAAALTLGLGTLMFPFATVLFDHVQVASLALMAFACLVYQRDVPEVARPRAGARIALLFGGGLAAGMAVVTNYTAVVLVAFLVIYALLVCRPRWHAAAFIAGGLPPAVLLGWYHAAFFGTPFTFVTLFQNQMFSQPDLVLGAFSLPRPGVMWKLLFSAKRGLFYLSPILVLSVIGMVKMGVRRGLRAELFVVLASFGAYWLINSGFRDWHAGWSFGPRYLIPAIPFLALPLAAAFERAPLLGMVLAATSVLMILSGTAVDVHVPDSFDDPVREYLGPLLAGRTLDVHGSEIAGPVSANPIGVYESWRYICFLPGSEQVRWNSFNLGEFVWPRSLLGLGPLFVIWGVGFALVGRWSRQPAIPSDTPSEAAPAEALHAWANPIGRLAEGRAGKLLLVAVLVLTAILAVSSARRKSVTVDEYALMPEGLALLKAGAFQIDRGVPPLSKVLFALPVAAFTSARLDASRLTDVASPWVCGAQFVDENPEDYHGHFMVARMVSVAVLILVCLLAYGFGRSLYGPAGGLIAGVFAALSPNLIAHGRLVTTDIYLAAAVVGALWLFDRHARRPSLGRAALWGVSVGVAALCKLTGVLLFIVFPIAAVLMWVFRSRLPAAESELKLDRRWLLGILAGLVVGVLTINAGYLFRGSFTRVGDYAFDSPGLIATQNRLPAFLPVPLPADFVKGSDTQVAETGYDAYLCGEFNTEGFWSYFLVGFLVKSPLPVTLLIVVAFLARRRLAVREIPLLATWLLLFGFFSLAGHKNVGIRYLLFLIPIACVWIGRIAATPAWNSMKRGRELAWIAGFAAVWMLVGTVKTWPDYLPYFNVAVGGASRGHEYLLDSNLDWGQDLIALKEYMREKGIKKVDLAYFGRVPPEVYGIEYRPLVSDPEKPDVVISANLLWGRMYFVSGTSIWPANRDTYAVFREIEPKAVLGHSLYVYDLRP